MAQNSKIRWRNVVLDAASIVSFCLTLWLAYADKSSSATVTGLMAVGFGALRYLPLIDTIEAFGLKAKLRQTVSEADAALDNLRFATATASRLAYFQLAYIGRMASPSWSDKRNVLRQVDESLAKVGVNLDEVGLLKEPILRFAMADVYYLLSRLVGERVTLHHRRVQEQIDKQFGGKPIPAADETYRKLIDEKRRIRGMDRLGDDLISHPRLPAIEAFMLEQLRGSGLPADEIKLIEPFAEKWGRAGQLAWNAKEITDDLLDLIQVHQDQSWESYYKAIFPDPQRQGNS